MTTDDRQPPDHQRTSARAADRGAPRHVPTLAESLGGPWGMAESTIPAVAYVAVYTASSSDMRLSAIVAVAIAALLALVRLVRRESPRAALSGLIGVAFAAWVAAKTGKAENYFLPGLLINAGYALALMISALVRWPVVGLVAGQFDGSGLAWRRQPARMRVMTRATWMWVGLFLLRLAVQLPLYFAGEVLALGIARTAMGVPLFALAIYVTYRWVRSVDEAVPLEPGLESAGTRRDPVSEST